MKEIKVLNTEDYLEEKLQPVSRMDLIKYAGASGDYNPIHLIDEEAEKAGLPGIIAHGMWTMGNLAKLFTPYLDEGYIKRYNVRFKGMVYLNDEIKLKAIVEEVQNNNILFKVIALNQKEKEVMSGNVEFSLFN